MVKGVHKTSQRMTVTSQIHGWLHYCLLPSPPKAHTHTQCMHTVWLHKHHTISLCWDYLLSVFFLLFFLIWNYYYYYYFKELVKQNNSWYIWAIADFSLCLKKKKKNRSHDLKMKSTLLPYWSQSPSSLLSHRFYFSGSHTAKCPCWGFKRPYSINIGPQWAATYLS